MGAPSEPAPEPEARGALSPGAFRTWLVLLLLLAATVRVPHLVAESVIGDEVFTRDVVAAPLAESMRTVVEDAVHPPIHSLVLKPWAAVFGDSVRSLRGFSFVFGVLTVLLVARLGRVALGSDVGALFAAGLVAVNDAQAFYGHTARSYALYAALMVLVLLAAARCVTAGADGRRLVAFGIAALFLVYTHYVGWLFLIALLVGAWLASPARVARRLTFATGAVGLAFVPWAVPVAFVLRGRGLDPNLGWMDRPTWQHPRWIYQQFAGVPDQPVLAFAGTLVALVLVGACAFALRRRLSGAGQPRRQVLALVLASAILPPLLLCALAQEPVRLPIWGTRHLLPGQAPFALVLAAGVLVLWRARRGLGIAAACALAVVSVVASVEGLRTPRVVPYADAARHLSAEHPATEPLFVASPHTLGLPLAYHAGAPRDLGLPPEPVEAPAALWLAYRPGQEPEAALAARFTAGGYGVAHERDFGRTPDDANRLRIVRLARGVRE